jgi:putative ABC transport system permease protein
MTLKPLSLQNLLRRPLRTTLTISGVALAAAAYVLLISLGQSFVRDIQSTVNLLGKEITVQQAGTEFPEMSWISRRQFNDLRTVSGVHDAFSVAIRVTRFRASKYFLVLGVGPQIPRLDGMRMIDGRRVGPGQLEVMLGYRAADALGVAAGQSIELQRMPVAVVGVYDSGLALLDRGAILPLGAHRTLFDIGDRSNLVFLELEEGAAPARVRREVERRFPDLETSRTDNLTDHYGQLDEIGRLVEKIAIVALLLAAFGVSNVMLMNVSERTKEIGILRAVGWVKPRLVVLILGEGVLLALLGGLAGVPMAQLILGLITLTDTSGLAPATVPLAAALDAVILSGIAGAFGTLPAAVRALKIEPALALRAG